MPNSSLNRICSLGVWMFWLINNIKSVSLLNRICSFGVWMLCWLTTLSQFAICPIKIFSFKQVSDRFLIFVLSYFYDWWSNKFAKHSKQFASWSGPMTCRFSDPQASYLLDAAFTELSLTTFEEDPTWPHKPIMMHIVLKSRLWRTWSLKWNDVLVEECFTQESEPYFLVMCVAMTGIWCLLSAFNRVQQYPWKSFLLW